MFLMMSEVMNGSPHTKSRTLKTQQCKLVLCFYSLPVIYKASMASTWLSGLLLKWVYFPQKQEVLVIKHWDTNSHVSVSVVSFACTVHGAALKECKCDYLDVSMWSS